MTILSLYLTRELHKTKTDQNENKNRQIHNYKDFKTPLSIISKVEKAMRI